MRRVRRREGREAARSIGDTRGDRIAPGRAGVQSLEASVRPTRLSAVFPGGRPVGTEAMRRASAVGLVSGGRRRKGSGAIGIARLAVRTTRRGVRSVHPAVAVAVRFRRREALVKCGVTGACVAPVTHALDVRREARRKRGAGRTPIARARRADRGRIRRGGRRRSPGRTARAEPGGREQDGARQEGGRLNARNRSHGKALLFDRATHPRARPEFGRRSHRLGSKQ